MDRDESAQAALDHELVAQVASAIVKRGMSTPAIFMLELHKPFATVLSALASFSQPVIDAIVGPHFSRQIHSLLGSRDAIEALIVAIELNQGQVS